MTPTETKARHLAIRKAYKQGASIRQLMARFHVSRFVIDQAISDIKRDAGRPGNPSRDLVILEKRRAGLSFGAIAKEVGLSRQAVYYRVKKLSA